MLNFTIFCLIKLLPKKHCKIPPPIHEYLYHLQHVEAQRLVLRAELTHLRPALHRPGNSNEYIRTRTSLTQTYPRTQCEWRA